MPDWLPGAAVAIGLAAVSSILTWRITSAKHEGQTDTELENEKRLGEARANTLRESINERDRMFRTTVTELKENITERDEVLRQDIRDLRDDFSNGIDDLRKAQNAHGERNAAQDKVNVYTAEAMQRIVLTQERHGDKLADHASMIKMLTDIVTEEREQRKTREKEARDRQQ